MTLSKHFIQYRLLPDILHRENIIQPLPIHSSMDRPLGHMSTQFLLKYIF